MSTRIELQTKGSHSQVASIIQEQLVVDPFLNESPVARSVGIEDYPARYVAGSEMNYFFFVLEANFIRIFERLCQPILKDGFIANL